MCHFNVNTEITSKRGDWGVWGGYMESAHFEVIWQGIMNIVHVFSYYYFEPVWNGSESVLMLGGCQKV